MKSVIEYMLGPDLVKSRFGVLWALTFGSLLWFIIDWCLGTTFRSMSMWQLWANNLFAATLLMLPFILSRRVWVQLATVALLDCLLMANLMYSRTYFTGIPPESYMLAGNLADFTASVWDSLRVSDIGFALLLIAGGIWAYRIPRTNIRRLAGRWGAWCVLLGAISGVGLCLRGGFHKQYDRLVESCYTATCGVPAYTVAGHIAYYLGEEKKATDPAVTAEIAEWLSEHSRLMPATALPDSIAPRKNLVIVLLESFESWPIGKEIDGKPITPYLNSLIADSSTFYAPRMLTQVDAGHSIDAQLLLTAGLLPTQGTVFSTRFPDNNYPTLNKAMRELKGATSSILTVDQLVTWNFGVIARAFGYDTILDRTVWENDEKIGNPAKLSDGSFLRQSVEMLKQGKLWPVDSAAMLTFVTYSGHNPFRLPERLKDPAFNISDAGLHPTMQNFSEMAHYTDSQLHTLVDYIFSRPDSAETMIVITGDHEGLASQRKDIRNHSAKEAELVDEGHFTPFIILNSPVGGRYEAVFGQVDIYPTLLTMLGLENYSWPGIGQSLLSHNKIGAAISSMTRELAGDTTGVAPDMLRHWENSRRISDMIIRTDYLKE